MRSAKEVRMDLCGPRTYSEMEVIIEADRLAHIKEIRRAIGDDVSVLCNHGGCPGTDGCQMARWRADQIERVLSLPCLQVEEPLDPRAVAAARDIKECYLALPEDRLLPDDWTNRKARIIQKHYGGTQ